MSDDTDTSLLLPGQIFQGRYEVLEHIGDGGFGGVYKARHLELGLTVALKTLHPQMLNDHENRSRFQIEGKILAELSHPNVVHFYENGISVQLIPYIVMEFLQGKSLQKVLNDAGKLPIEQAIDIIMQVCDALAAAHQCGIVHRDLKPNNIILLTKRDGMVKLVDFGLSRVMASSKVSANQHLTRPGFLIGSVRYMSPEQCLGGRADPRSDIYSLGCILYEAISGNQPLTADNPVGLLHKHANETPVPLDEVVSSGSLPRGLTMVLDNAMAKDPRARYQSAEQMRRDLELVRKGKGDRVKPQKLSKDIDFDKLPTNKPPRNKKIVFASLVIVTLLLLLTPLYPKLQLQFDAVIKMCKIAKQGHAK